MQELRERLPMEMFAQGHPLGNLAQTLPMEKFLQGHPMGQWKSFDAIAVAESSNARTFTETSMEELLQRHPMGQ